MRWSNVAIIFRREVSDQVRDRRTLFMIFVLPILLYPILGIGIVQFSAALTQKPRSVLVVGSSNLPSAPPLIVPERHGFDPSLFDTPDEAGKLKILVPNVEGEWRNPARRQRAVREGVADAVLTFPPDFHKQLDRIESAANPDRLRQHPRAEPAHLS